ncbi:hypothetical protein EYF80_014791 [Liparis tanakae]|uniref:Uncharacterized protein n=1 Tax=Liparis tanakae TaxID=230148 RepID=A0A4Z2IC57_9TELE|nr:hypothetical protein EYF80_014791 [Liparis tanakae]
MQQIIAPRVRLVVRVAADTCRLSFKISSKDKPGSFLVMSAWSQRDELGDDLGVKDWKSQD